jgi:hypothetical protein
MSLSYSSITNYGKVTLPSVESWNTNNNIIKEPPKSITTRKIDKVGQNSSIVDMADESGSRISEMINLYARGVNPMVSVRYTNDNGGVQAKLPYTIMKDGVFRPPTLSQENLLPLSRMPRVWTHASSNPGLADFTRKLECPKSAEKTHEVKDAILKQNIQPTRTYNIFSPLTEPS